MSGYRDAYRAMVIDALVCPKCRAMNRDGAHLIEMDATGTRALCDVCAVEGPLDQFTIPQPKKEN